MDIAGLSKLSADTLVLIVSVLGFLVRGCVCPYRCLPEYYHTDFRLRDGGIPSYC